MNALLWIAQVLLALVFLAHGLLFFVPPPDIAAQMNASFPRAFQLLLGAAEVAAAAGLILPGLTRIQPRLVPLAAAGLVPIMIGATLFHLWRREWSSAVITSVLLLMAAFVARMRWRKMSIPARSPQLS